MSKIPQGEWNAIATRHARGETIAKIAQDYGCTAPAIHYILKRQKERAGVPAAGAAAPAAVAALPAEAPPERRPAAEVRPLTELRHARGDEPRREETPAFKVTLGPVAGERQAEATRVERAGDRRLEAPPPAARGSALAAGLDGELQDQAEQAITAFRTSLESALADRSPARREALRAAASDLMRMAARTMIVLDRLSAAHEREQPGGRAPDYPRSAHARTAPQFGRVG